MRLNIHDWMDDWFLSLSENPDKLDERIRIYEHARILGLICFFIVIAMYLLVVFNTTSLESYGFMFSLVVLMLVLNVQTDIYTKILKLQRQQQKRDANDAKPPSGTGKKRSISVIALMYGPALSALILGILFFMFIT